MLLELQARPMQTAANRAHGKLQNAGDLVVITVVHFSQNENLAVLVAEAAQSPLYLHGPLLAEQPFVGLFAVVQRLQANSFFALVSTEVCSRLFRRRLIAAFTAMR